MDIQEGIYRRYETNSLRMGADW